MRLKSDMYAPEQAAIRQRVIDILELDELNSTTLYELDNNHSTMATSFVSSSWVAISVAR
jgi:hypothetical protein